jgi:acetyl-CoA acetyltransferase
MPLYEAYSYTDKPVVISAVVGKTDSFVVHERDELDRMNGVALSAEKALSQAGLRREDIDLIELHDMATILEIVELENMGFFKRGEGWRGAMEKITWLDGELPVNTSGGLKSKGHPIGATGVAQAYEIFHQMRREAGERQAKKNVSRALSMSMGGFGQNAYTIIYEAGW